METSLSYDEKELLQQVAQGDEIAFGKLMQQYTNLLASHVFRLINSKEQTEEIVQDVFLKIWQTREKLTEVRNFRIYLYVVSRNKVYNAIRSLIREKRKIEIWKTVEFANSDETDSEKEWKYNLLEKAISQIPPQQQQAWMLSRRNGLKYKEIAQKMQLSEETVKKYIQYANSSITRYMEHYIAFALLGIVLFSL